MSQHIHVNVGVREPTWRDFGIGVGCEIFMGCTLGTPLELIKTRIASEHTRGKTLRINRAIQETIKERGFRSIYSGLYPWVCLESLTGGVLIYANHKCYSSIRPHFDKITTPYKSYISSHVLSGIVAGLAQGLIMTPLVRMKTAEMTRDKGGTAPISYFISTLKKDGVQSLFRGISPLLMRQMSNWGTRFGVARALENKLCHLSQLRNKTTDCTVSINHRAMCSLTAGIVSCWNHPLDVVAVTMQSKASSAQSLSAYQTAAFIYQTSGVTGFTRGIGSRMMLSCWATVCMVFGTDYVKSSLDC